LGRALETEVREGRLFQRVEFAVEANPLARIAYGLYRGKFLNAVSVGFLPLRWEEGAPGSGYRRKHLEQELIEVSAVCIPANPEALQLGLKSGVINRTDLRQLADALRPWTEAEAGAEGRQICSDKAPGETGMEARLLLLARAVRWVLKQA
jgi:phage head maturation protease